MNRFRVLALLILVASLFVAWGQPGTALAASVYFNGYGGDTSATFGPNATISISGDLTGGCIDMFGQYSANVYIVPHGSISSSSRTQMSAKPNAVINSSLTNGLFDGETIGFTAPSGKIGPGDYDIVLDLCADGFYDPGTDYIAGEGTPHGAFSVVIPANIPVLPSADIQSLKSSSQQEANAWSKSAKASATLFALYDLYTLISDVSGGGAEAAIGFYLDWVCTALPANPDIGIAWYCPTVGPGDLMKLQVGVIKEQMGQAAHYQAIANDPPDPNYTSLVTLDPTHSYTPNTAVPLESSFTKLGTQVSVESATLNALLHSMEKYEGAQQAGDAQAALLQAKQLQHYAAMAAQGMSTTNARLGDVATQTTSSGLDFAGAATSLANLLQRLQTSGFTADEIAGLQALGLSQTDIANLKAQLTETATQHPNDNYTLDSYATYGDIPSNVQALQSLNATTSSSLQTLATDMGGIVSTLQSQVNDTSPTAKLNGPYSGTVGSAVTFDGSGSTTPAGTGPLTYAWDLTGSGTFTDASGPTPSFTFNAPRSGVVGLKVTNANNQSDVTYAPLTVAAGNQPPVISALNPAGPVITASAGQSIAFSGTATDAENDQLTYRWSWDGTTVGTGSTYTRSFTTADAGFHALELAVSDAGGTALKRVGLLVTAPAPATPTNLQATAGDRTGTVTWSPPASSAGTGIDRYDVTISAGGWAQTVQVTDLTNLSASFTGLTNGAHYTVAVRAHNPGGLGPAATVSFIPAGVPGTPSGLQISTAAGSASATWNPANPNGATVDRYNVTISSGSSFSQSTDITDLTNLNATFTGLTVGTQYIISVTAHNAVGWSAPDSASFTVVAPPGAPTNVDAVAGNGQAAVSWSPPSDLGGGAITRYDVTAMAGSFSQSVRVTDLGAGCSSAGGTTVCATLVPGLTNGTQYSISVTATNSAGSGPAAGATVTPAASSSGGTPPNTFYVTERWEQGIARVALNPDGSHTTNASFVKGLPPSGPDSIVFDHHGNMVISNTDVGTIETVNPSTGAVIDPQVNHGTIPTVADLALDPSSDSVVAVGYNNTSLVRVDLTTGTVTSLNTDNVPYLGGVTFNATGSRLFVSSHTGRIVEIDPTSGHAVRSIQVGGYPDGMTFDPSTGHAFVSGCGGICELYTGTDSHPALALLKRHTSVDGDGLAADGQGHILVVNWALNQLDLATDAVKVIAGDVPGADDVAPLVGAGAPVNNDTPPTLTVPPAQAIPYHGSLTFGVSATDGDGDHLTLQATGLPAGLSFTDKGDGTGTVSGTVTATPGTYPVTFTTGDGKNTDTKQVIVTVTQQVTDLAYNGDTTVTRGQTAHLSATLLEAGGTPVAGKTVTLALGSQSCTGTTDSTGQAACSLAQVGVPGGQQTATATFAGDADYLPSSDSKPVMVQVPTAVTFTQSSATTADYHDAATLGATLVDDAGSPVAGATLTFTVGADQCTAATAANGQASCTITPSETAGTYPVKVGFAGRSPYLPSQAAASFNVTREETAVSYTGATLFAQGRDAQLTAQLREDGQSALAGRTVTLSLGGQSCTATTDTGGQASCTVTAVSGSLGPQTIGATFAGDGYYQPSSDTKQGLIFAYLATGSFVVGDSTASSAGTSGSVTWWGAQWSTQNTLSGGSSPAAFKGFADTLNANPPTCSSQATWSASPGNSSTPPASVPSYMAVVVASSITKSGATISGNVARIVIVKTNPGYAADPGHAGSGTIVATLCSS